MHFIKDYNNSSGIIFILINSKIVINFDIASIVGLTLYLI